MGKIYERRLKVCVCVCVEWEGAACSVEGLTSDLLSGSNSGSKGSTGGQTDANILKWASIVVGSP